MRSLVITGMAALMLTGCNTLRGTGRDLQVLGETVTGASHQTADWMTGEDSRTVTTRSDNWWDNEDYVGRQEPPSKHKQVQRTAEKADKALTQRYDERYYSDRYQVSDRPGDRPVALQWPRLDEPRAAQTIPLERATDLMEADLVSADGRYLGHIEQIVFDTERGYVTFAIVAVQGDRYLVPWNAFSKQPGRNAITLHSGPSEIRHEQMFTPSQREMYGQGQETNIGLKQASTNDLIGLSITNHQGEQLGQIEDIVIDPQRGRAVFLLLSTDEPNQLAAVPFDAFQMQQRLVTRAMIPADPESLQELSFQANQHPYRDASFARRVQDQFADREPYWQVFAFPGGGPERIDTAQLQTVHGTIQSVGTFRDETGSAEGLRLRVRTQDNELITVHAGPAGYARQQGVTFTPGDKVVIRGAPQTINGTEALVAVEISKGETLRLRDEEGRARWATDQMDQSQQQNQRQQREQPQQQRTNQQRPQQQNERETF